VNTESNCDVQLRRWWWWFSVNWWRLLRSGNSHLYTQLFQHHSEPCRNTELITNRWFRSVLAACLSSFKMCSIHLKG